MDAARRENLTEFEGRLGHAFRDVSHLNTALCHSSYIHEHPEEHLEANERMEFLGDAVLELCITRLLYFKYPDEPEGKLSKARSGMVNEHRLEKIARGLGLGEYLLLGKGEELQGGREKPSILADALEAVLAGIYLDSGLEGADGTIKRLFEPYLKNAIRRASRKDYKTRIQELVQEKQHMTPRYTLEDSRGPDHDKTFFVALTVGEEVLARGEGKSKKEAEQHAAQKGLEILEEEASPEN